MNRDGTYDFLAIRAYRHIRELAREYPGVRCRMGEACITVEAVHGPHSVRQQVTWTEVERTDYNPLLMAYRRALKTAKDANSEEIVE